MPDGRTTKDMWAQKGGPGGAKLGGSGAERCVCNVSQESSILIFLCVLLLLFFLKNVSLCGPGYPETL